MPISNTVFSFSADGINTFVTVQGPTGLINGNVVEILNSYFYTGPHIISNIQTYGFTIPVPFVINESDCVWQVSRPRPTIVNPAPNETVDTLRQAVNQISNDVGDRTQLDSSNKDIVSAINEAALKNLILSIATN